MDSAFGIDVHALGRSLKVKCAGQGLPAITRLVGDGLYQTVDLDFKLTGVWHRRKTLATLGLAQLDRPRDQ
jgi:hypothetical protein